MNDLPPAVVKDLIAMGSLEGSLSATWDQLLARLKPFDWVTRKRLSDKMAARRTGTLITLSEQLIQP